METIEFNLIKNIKLLHFKSQGTFDYEYLVSRIIDVNKDPDFKFLFNTFVDFEDAHLLATHKGFLVYQDFFKRLQQFSGKRKWAIYSKNDKTLKNAYASHQMVSNHIEVKVFKERSPALDFLGIKASDLIEK